MISTGGEGGQRTETTTASGGCGESCKAPGGEFGHVGHGDGHLPANEPAEPRVGHLHVERQLRNPHAELDEPRVSTVLDDDRSGRRSARLGSVEEHESARLRHLHDRHMQCRC